MLFVPSTGTRIIVGVADLGSGSYGYDFDISGSATPNTHKDTLIASIRTVGVLDDMFITIPTSGLPRHFFSSAVVEYNPGEFVSYYTKDATFSNGGDTTWRWPYTAVFNWNSGDVGQNRLVLLQ